MSVVSAFRRLPPGAAVGLLVIAGLIVVGLLVPYPLVTAVDPTHPYQPPGPAHLFGTDEVGADVLARTLGAGAVDLPFAILGTGVSLLIGVPLGLLMSVRSTWSERGMRALDIFQGLPLLILALALTSLGGRKPYLVVIAIALFGIPIYVRIMRSQLLTMRESVFVESARISGASELRVLFGHLLPNLRGIILTQTSLTLAASILVVAALSFVGVGMPPPTPSWGVMIRNGTTGITAGYWWLIAFPGLAIFVSVLSANTAADALRRRGGA